MVSAGLIRIINDNGCLLIYLSVCWWSALPGPGNSHITHSLVSLEKHIISLEPISWWYQCELTDNYAIITEFGVYHITLARHLKVCICTQSFCVNLINYYLCRSWL